MHKVIGLSLYIFSKAVDTAAGNIIADGRVLLAAHGRRRLVLKGQYPNYIASEISL